MHEITAAALPAPTAATVADELLRRCAATGVAVQDVFDLITVHAGRTYTAFDRHPLTQQPCRYASSITQQQDPAHDQSAFQ